MRDLIRARYQVGKAQHRARQQLKMYLLRTYYTAPDVVNAGICVIGPNQMPFPVQQIVFQEDARRDQRSHRALERYDQRSSGRAGVALGAGGPGGDGVARDGAAARRASLVAELGDFNRFRPSRPVDGLSRTGASEHTTEPIASKGHHQTWATGRPAALGGSRLAIPRSGAHQSALEETPGRIAQSHHRFSWQAQRRLHHRYQHLTRVGKKKSKWRSPPWPASLSGLSGHRPQVKRARPNLEPIFRRVAEEQKTEKPKPFRRKKTCPRTFSEPEAGTRSA